MSSRTALLGRLAASTTAIGVAAAGALTLSAAPAAAAPKRIETPYAYQAWAYGTRVVAGSEQGAVGSGPTVRSLLGCTKVAPKQSYKNGLAQLGDNSMFSAAAVVSRAETYRRPARKVFGSRSHNQVADVVIGAADGPQLVVGSLRATANTYARNGKFGGGGNVSFLKLDVRGELPEQLDGPAQELVDAFDDNLNGAVKTVLEEARAAGVPVVIPGIGEISLGESYKRVNRRAVSVRTYALRVKLENGSVANIGHAFSRVRRDVPESVFSGRAHATEATMLQGNVRLGRLANIPLPCPGTNGRWTSVSEAGVNLPGAARLSGLRSQAFGVERSNGRTIGRTRSQIADVNLGGGQVVLSGIRGQVNVVADPRGRILSRTLRGTTVGSITVNGETQRVPGPGQRLVVPGVVRVEVAQRENLGTRGVAVTAARVTMLDGSGTVVNLGNARARINRS